MCGCMYMCGYCNCVGVLVICNMYTSTLRLPWLRFYRAFFLSCKANARVKLAKTGHGPHSSKLVVIVLFCRYLCCSVIIDVVLCLFVCKCVPYHCHRVFTQLQFTNISISGSAIFFSHYLITGTTFRKMCWTQNVCFDFLYNFCIKHFSF